MPDRTRVDSDEASVAKSPRPAPPAPERPLTPRQLQERILKQHSQSLPFLPAHRRRRGSFWHGLKTMIWAMATIIFMLAGVFLYLAQIDLSHFAPFLERQVALRAGLALRIDGAIHLTGPLIRPGLVVQAITVSMPQGKAGAATAPLVRSRPSPPFVIERLEVHINPLSWLDNRGVLELSEIVIDRATIPVFPAGAESNVLRRLTTKVRALLDIVPEYFGTCFVRSIRFRDSVLVFPATADHPHWQLPLDGVSVVAQDMQFNVEWREDDFASSARITARFADYTAFLEGRSAELTLVGTAGGLEMRAEGAVTNIAAPSLDLSFRVRGPAGADTDQQTDLAGRLSGSPLQALRGSFSGVLWGSESAGQFIVSGRKPRTLGVRMRAQVVSLDDVVPLWRMAARAMFRARFPEGEEGLPALSTDRLHLQIDTDEVRVGKTALGAGRLVARVDESGTVLHLEQRVGAGRIDVLMSSASSGGPQAGAEADLTVTARRIDLSLLEALAGWTPPFRGPLSLSLEVTAKGRSFRDLQRHLSGQGDVVIGQGRLAPSFLSSIPQMVPVLWREAERRGEDGEAGAFRCLVARLKMTSGVVGVRTFIMETGDGLVTGEGVWDTATGMLDAVLRPRPKDPRALVSALDLHLKGELAAPQVVPETENLTRGLSSALSPLMAPGGAPGKADFPLDAVPQDTACWAAL